ncbi:MAG: pilus assembly protein TadG-related protein [Pseudomonadota bacterium]
MKTSFKTSFFSLKKNNRGSAALLMGLFAPVVMVAVGSAVDYSNLLRITGKSKAALDSASLAAATELSTGSIDLDEAEARARELFDVNLAGVLEGQQQAFNFSLISQAHASAPLDQPASDSCNLGYRDFEMTFNPETAQITTSATITVPTTLMSVAGYDCMTAELASSASYRANENSDTKVEFSFVLDVTGSMGNGGRLAALKEAMTTSIDILLPEDGSNDDRVRVGMVPYAYSVNLGEWHKDAVGSNTASASSANECVTEREGTNAFTDVVPNENISNTLYETDSALRRFSSGACPGVIIRPLTNDRTDLLEDVDDFRASGFTAGHIGIDWGFNLLSHNFRNFWPDASAPASHSAENVRKVLVVMTDGAFNTAYYDETTQGSLGLARQQFSVSRDAALQFCDLAKEEDQNIEVYTVAFRAGNSAESLLRACATPDDEETGETYFFDADSNEGLIIAFQRIVAKELQVFLTQ